MWCGFVVSGEGDLGVCNTVASVTGFSVFPRLALLIDDSGPKTLILDYFYQILPVSDAPLPGIKDCSKADNVIFRSSNVCERVTTSILLPLKNKKCSVSYINLSHCRKHNMLIYDNQETIKKTKKNCFAGVTL